MSNPRAAMVVIGDEILSGRTRDSNMYFLAGELVRAGIELRHVAIIPDEAEIITRTVKELSQSFDYVFTSGGIGPTHDDVTADAVAAAFDASIDIREDARALLEAHFAARGVEATGARMRMARIPEGAVLIDNPVSIAPGFSLGNVHVMAGVPNVFEAMVAGLLPRLTGGAPILSQAWRVMRGEGEIAPQLGEIAAEFPDLSIGSYPFTQNGAFGTNLVVRGTDALQIEAALLRLAEAFAQ